MALHRLLTQSLRAPLLASAALTFPQSDHRERALSEAAGRRRLAAILAADATGFSRLMADDEDATVTALDASRAVFRAHIDDKQGRVIDMAGDSVLALFETATGAVSAALAIQRELEAASTALTPERRMRFRIGIHLGDVIEKPDGWVYGDGVNIAARLQALAAPGAVAISAWCRKRCATALRRVSSTWVAMM